jgi:hypothetical protein
MSEYPRDKLDGLESLTDETGIIQHTKFSIIDRKHGYATDDNARALIAALRHNQVYRTKDSINLAKTYLMFLLHMHREDGRFHNILGFNREYLDDVGSEDSTGHALWALGYTLNSNATDEMKKLAKWLFDKSLPAARRFTSPRARAFTLLGLTEYKTVHSDDDNVQKDIKKFSEQLVNQYREEAINEWKWFESYLTYANARLPNAIIKAHETSMNKEHLFTALESLDFLISVDFTDSVFQPVGTNGWYFKNSKKAKFDQQPIEASCMVEATVDAWKITGEEKYVGRALDAFKWFHAKNSAKINLINQNNFTCYDGITPRGLNLNQGAESTISYYLAYLKLVKNGLL